MAHPRILAQRQSAAHNRILAAANKLARAHGLKPQADALAQANARLPAMQQAMQAEAIADLLEALHEKAYSKKDIDKLAEPEPAIDMPDDAVGAVTVETVETIPADAEKPIGKDRKKEGKDE